MGDRTTQTPRISRRSDRAAPTRDGDRMSSNAHDPRGTALSPRQYQGPTHIEGDVKLNRQYFAYRAGQNLVAGSLLSVMFTIDRPAAVVWPYFRDFNLWLDGRHYSAVVGDSEGKPMALRVNPAAPPVAEFEVTRVFPEHVILLSQPLSPTDDSVEIPLPGDDGVARGFQVFVLNEHGGHTIVTILLQHASVMATGSKADKMTDDEAIEPWRDYGIEGFGRWRDTWIPKLKQLVYDIGPGGSDG